MIIYLSHIIFIVPLLLYVALKKDKVNVLVYPILIVLGVKLSSFSHDIKNILITNPDITYKCFIKQK